MPSDTTLLFLAAVLTATLLWIVRSSQRASLKREMLEPESLAPSPRRVRSSRAHRRRPLGVKQSALLPGRHAGQ